MRQICLFNKGVDAVTAKKGIEKLALDYINTGIKFSYDIENIDIKTEFIKYNPKIYKNSLGLDFYIISKEAKRIRKKYGDKYDLITIFIDKNDWKMGDGLVAGWNMGEFFSRYQIQQVMVSTERSVYLILSQELMHSWDQFSWLELKVDIAQLLGVRDFDRDIVHKYQYEYNGIYGKLALVINRTFEIRKLRYENELKLNQTRTILVTIVTMLTQIIQDLKIQIGNIKRSAVKVVLPNINK